MSKHVLKLYPYWNSFMIDSSIFSNFLFSVGKIKVSSKRKTYAIMHA